MKPNTLRAGAAVVDITPEVGKTMLAGYLEEGAGHCRIGSHVRFYPNCFIQGTAPRFVVEDYVDFFPGTYISLGSGETSFLEIGHHSHFAPGCVLYGLSRIHI